MSGNDSHHAPAKPESSNPVLWTLVVLVFLGITAGWFAHWMSQGALHARSLPKVELNKPKAINHEAFISDTSKAFLTEGQGVYEANCITCHGIDGGAGSVANARIFNQQPMANGSDPYAMYETLVNGYQAMPAQPGLSPAEKYAVVHYIRETFQKPNLPDAYFEVTDDYMASAPWPAPGAGGEGAPYVHPLDKDQTVPISAVMAGMVAEAAVEVDSARLGELATRLSVSDRTELLALTDRGTNGLAKEILAAIDAKDYQRFQTALTGSQFTLNRPAFAVASKAHLEAVFTTLSGAAPAETKPASADHDHGGHDHGHH
jgi:mono/diheme cytochrome c family protein